MAMKNIYQHSINLEKIRIDNADKATFAQKLINLPYRGYEVEELSDGRKIVITKPGGKTVYGRPKKEDFLVFIYDPNNENLWQISHQQILNDIQGKVQENKAEAKKFLLLMERTYNGEEPANFINDIRALHFSSGESPEALIKAYKWIWGQEDVNYPNGEGRLMSSPDRTFTLLHGDCIELLKQFSFKFDMIFADPPYFLSNGGISVQSGKVVCVDKGEWDKGGTREYVDSFNRTWIKECREKLKDNGTIWVSGTYHNIFSIANILTELGLNVVTWAKTNPPPNISCRYFTYSTEFIIWARKSPKVPHCYNYEVMKQINEDKQMTDVWQLPAIARWEKSCGKHPTQKPLSVLSRIVLASTHSGAWILDPFTGSSTTGIAANLLGRRFLGIDKEEEYLILSQNRKKEIEQISNFTLFRKKIKDIALLDRKRLLSVKEENTFSYDLPF